MSEKARRFIVVAFALSKPGTMGGNSKIALEIARHLSKSHEVHFILPDRRLPTLEDTIGHPEGLIVHTVTEYAHNDLRHPIDSKKHYTCELHKIFNKIALTANDIVYSASDFHVDTLPCRALKRKFGFFWIASQFLFIPSLFENLIRRYRFPALKYILVWIYSYLLFFLARHSADAFVITNDSDRVHFPDKFQKNVFAYYGGVNIEQIPSRSNNQTNKQSINPSVVFCSRLHPQKGIDAFLDTWKKVIEKCPNSRLNIIGNGEKNYESYLKDKAKRLGISDSISWLGYVNNEAKYEIYAKSDLLVHPTVFDNNGMVAAEALCTGLPVVMQDLPALRDVYTIGCLKVPFGDRGAFAAAIVSLLTDPAKRSAIAPNPAQLAALRDHWRWESRAKEFQTWLSIL